MMYETIRAILLNTVLKLHQKDLIQLNSGNVSVRASEDHIAITPTGVPYDEMTAEDMVIIDLDGVVVDGRHKPSSETPMHTIIYKDMPAVKAIVHSHSPYALAFAAVGRNIPIICTEGLALRGPVPVAEYECPGTEAQGLAAIKAMKGPPSVIGTLLKNHGVLATGANLVQAYSAAYRIEMAAKIYLLALQIGNPDILTDEQIREIRSVYFSKKSPS
ncbi:MAG: class II aldolase/adducin family protein [Deltaproteobacteria bacterium]|nr:class II aldolase/adducin family protein [Deltaproteobacteria bacterium]